MSSLLNVGARALLANQIGLSTTGHNIANAGTPGYSRQTAVQGQVAGQYTGSGYIGKGVEILGIERAHNEFLTRQAAAAQSVQAMDVTRATRLLALEEIFKGGKTGLGAAVSDLLNAFSDVASTPNDLSARSVVLARADEMAARMRDAQTRLDDLQKGVNSQLGDSVRTINSLAGRLASLNEQIARAQGGGQSPNDLLDQRDQLLRELNRQVQTTSVAADDGSLSIFVGSQALVLGNKAAQVAITTDDANQSKLQLVRSGLATTIDETTLGGGTVAGLLRFQNSDLAQTRDGLGRMALTLATEINAQHRLGLDLDGKAGGDVFKPIAIPDAMASAGNAGNAVIGATVANASALAASSYQIKFGAGGSIEVQRLSDGKTTSFTGPMPIEIDGLRLSLQAGSAAEGDSLVLKPYAGAAGELRTVLRSPRELAVGSPVQARPGAGNAGSVAVARMSATSADANLNAPVTLTFNGAGGFDVAGTGTGDPTGVPYVAGQPISYNGWTIVLNGTPKPGDTITIQPASVAYGNSNAGNAQALLALRDKAVFDGAPMTDGYAALMAQVGVRSQSAQYAAEISTSIAGTLETERTSESGVNLDEEAAKLLQYQQAYQASSKMIQIAQSIFDSLLKNMN